MTIFKTDTVTDSGPLFAFALFIIAFISFFYGLGSVPLFDLDEGAFSEATREMVASGNYLTTYLGGEPRFDKPILIYWLQAASAHLFGVNEFAFRLPSALMASLWALALFGFAQRFFDRKVALAAALFMIGSLQITIIAKAAIADALLNCLIASSMFLVWWHLESKSRKVLYLAYAVIALGVLAKGPVAILVPGLSTLLYFALNRSIMSWFRLVLNPVGILIFLLIAAPWYILEYMDQGDAFINGFLFKHNLSRFNTSFEGHSGSLFYYIPVLLLGTLPFSGIMLLALGRIKEWFRNELTRFLVLWFLSVFLFFSFSGTKLPHYVIYGYTPLFILMGIAFARVKSRWVLFLPAVLLLIALLAIPFIAQTVAPLVKDEYARYLILESQPIFDWRYKLSLIILLAALLVVYQSRLTMLWKTALIGCVTLLAVNQTAIATYAKLAQEPIKNAAHYARANGWTINMWGINAPSFMVYRQSVVQRKAPKSGDIVLTKITKVSQLANYTILFKQYGIVLARVETSKSGGKN